MCAIKNLKNDGNTYECKISVIASLMISANIGRKKSSIPREKYNNDEIE